MKTPSKIQNQAIMHLQGPAEVIAGPGSGKTFTIIQRILYLINHCQISPDKILVITYTKAAALEMKERYEKAISEHAKGNIDGNVHFGTFHSVCFHILQQSGKCSSKSLIKELDRRELIHILLGNMGLGEKSSYDIITTILNEISRLKNIPQDTAIRDLGDVSTEEFQEIDIAYNKYLKEQSMIDFDDMIGECLQLLTNNSDICRRYQEQFAYILADEFQDINVPQYQILKLLSLPRNNLFVVGDDDQAIYGFRGATPGIMKQFMLDYSEANQFMLTENYRSGKEIVTLAKNMISRNKERFHKEFQPVRMGGQIVFECFDNRQLEEEQLIQNLSQLDHDQIDHSAIILRTNLGAMQYSELLQNAKIPIKGMRVSGQTIFGSFILEDIQAFMSFVYLGNKRGDLIRFMNKPNKFFSREALTEELVVKGQMEQYYKNNSEMCRKVELFYSQLMLAEKVRPDLAVSLFRNTIGYDNYLREKAVDLKQESVYLRQADQVQEVLKGYIPGTDLKLFIRQEERKRGMGKNDSVTKEGIRILTMHSAKGLEFDRVYLPDVNEGIIPGKKCITEAALEEERRLLYVAITRAKDSLTIYYTKERNRKISRYLDGFTSPHPQ